ncbi:DUF4886 domain-containing protein [Gemmatimonadota bacterium]
MHTAPHPSILRLRLLLPLLLLLMGSATGCDPEVRVVGPEPGDTMVLFVGSSYFGWNDLTSLFANLSDAGGHSVFTGSVIQYGYYLDYFAGNPQVAGRLAAEEWDFMLLQGVGVTTAYPETHHEILPGMTYHDVFAALETLQATAADSCPTAETIFQMPWAYEDGMTWVAGQTDTYFDMQQHVYTNSMAWADSLDLAVAPVGWAFRRIMQDQPVLHYLYDTDYNHPSLRGSYLMACVFYGIVFGEPSLGIEFYPGMEESEARYLQAAADEVVFDPSEPWYPSEARGSGAHH